MRMMRPERNVWIVAGFVAGALVVLALMWAIAASVF